MKTLRIGHPRRGPIERAVWDAQLTRRALIRSGTSELEADRQIGEGLKAVLYRPCPTALKRKCLECDDTGFVADVSVDVRHIYGPDAALKRAARKCEGCDYWQQRWEQYQQKVEGRRSDLEDAPYVAAAMTTKRRGR